MILSTVMAHFDSFAGDEVDAVPTGRAQKSELSKKASDEKTVCARFAGV
jgi:hypothetical protein